MKSRLHALFTGLIVAGLATIATTAGPADAAPATRLTPPVVTRYVALGDSYTAGPLIPVTQVANGCFRSTNNYPSLVARALAVPTFVDVSCSGAQTKDMTTGQLPGVAPQFDALTPDTDLVSVEHRRQRLLRVRHPRRLLPDAAGVRPDGRSVPRRDARRRP